MDRRRNHYTPKDLLKILDSPRCTQEKHVWDLDVAGLLRNLEEEHIRPIESVDFATNALVLLSSAKIYSVRVTSMEKDTNACRLRVSKFSRIEVNEPDNSEEEQEHVVPEVTAKSKQQAPQAAEEPPTVLVEVDVAEVPALPPPPIIKPPKPIDIQIYLEQIFVKLQRTLHNFDPESAASNSIFTVIDRQLRRKCCDFFLKCINEPIPLMDVLRKFLRDADGPDDLLLTNPIERKRFLVTKMYILVDVRNDVFLPNVSIQADMEQLRTLLKEYILEEIVQLACDVGEEVEDCLHPIEDDRASFVEEGIEEEVAQDGGPQQETISTNVTRDSGLGHDSTVEEGDGGGDVTTTLNGTQDSGMISGTQETSTIATTQDSGFVSGTQESSIFGTQDSEIISGTQETNDIGIVSGDVSTMEAEEPNLNDDIMMDNRTLDDDTGEDLQPSVEETESLRIDCAAVRECCQETATTSMTVNRVQFSNIFGLPRRLLRKKLYFRLPDDILEWARIHRNLNLMPKKTSTQKKPTKTGFKQMKHKDLQILNSFIKKNQRSRINRIHLNKLQSKCFIPLVSLSSSTKDAPPTITSTAPPSGGGGGGDVVQNSTQVEEVVMQQAAGPPPNEMEDLMTGPTAELRGTSSLNEIFDNNLLLSTTSCCDDESGVEVERQHCDEDDIETDSYKTLTHYSNVESGIFTDMTMDRSSTRGNTPSCNATRNNSFFSEYQDDITNLTATPIPTAHGCGRAGGGVGGTLQFDPFDVATQQLQEVPEGNVLNQIAERMRDYQERERQLLEMHQRVDKWHQSIRERLLHAKRRENWDIVKYEDKLLKKIPETPDTLHFALVVARKSHEEICRDFLATLVLANEGNVIITKTNTDPYAVNNFTVSKAVQIVRNHEAMHAGMQQMSSFRQHQVDKPTMPTSSGQATNSAKTPFIQRLYGSKDSDDEDDQAAAFMTDINNQLDCYASDQEELLQPEARLNIEYDRPVPQAVRGRRGRKPKVPPKNRSNEDNVYVFDNKQYDNGDLDDYVERCIRQVNAFEQRQNNSHNNNNNGQEERVIVNTDLPLVLSVPSSKRMRGVMEAVVRSDHHHHHVVTSPRTKLSISKRNEVSGLSRRIYNNNNNSSSDDDDDVPLSGLYTPRRPSPPAKLIIKLKTFEKNTTDSYLKRYNILNGDEEFEPSKKRGASSRTYNNIDSGLNSTPRRLSPSSSELMKHKASESKNTTMMTPPSYLKRHKVLDSVDDDGDRRGGTFDNSSVGPSRLQNRFETPTTTHSNNNNNRGVSSNDDDYAIAGPSGLQNNQRNTYSDDEDYLLSDDDDDYEHSVGGGVRKRSLTPNCLNLSSTPLNKKSKHYISPGSYGANFNLSRITSADTSYTLDSDS